MLTELRRRMTNIGTKKNTRRFFEFAQLLLIAIWPLLLLNTTAYFSIYVLCSVAAVFAFATNRKYPPNESRTVYGVTAVFSFVFSLLPILANYELFVPIRENFLTIIVEIIAGFVVAENVLLFLYRRLPQIRTETNKRAPYKSAIVFLSFFVVFSTIDLLYLFYSAYPGMVTNDSFTQITQVLYGITSNHHPFWHTILIKCAFSIGFRLFGNINAAIAVYSVCQLLFISAALSFSLTTLYRAGVKGRYVFLCGLPFAVLPYHIVYSVTMWKDVVFAVATLLFVVFFFRTLNKIGNHIVNTIFLVVFAILFCVWRSNAWLALVASVALFFVFLRKKHIKIVALLAIAVVVSWVLRSPVISLLGIQQPDFVESLSVPVQQVARVIVDDGYISDEDYTLLNKIMDTHEVKDLYLDYLSDPIKNEIRSKGQDYLTENKMEYLKLWVRVGVHNPASYVKAWVDQTKGYYNAGYKYWVNPYREGNEYLGIEKKTFYNDINTLYLTLNKEMNENVLAQPFISIGLCVWILTALGVTLFLRKRDEWLIFIPLMMVIATLLVATPVFSEFRYVYFMIMTAPFLITIGIHSFKETKGETNNG